MSPLAADVVVVGGGIMGAATAFFLRRRGRSVILIERGLVGQQASGVNFGNVRREGRALSELPLSNRAREIWGRIPELLGEDVEFRPTGYLRCCYDPDQVGVLEDYARQVRDYGLELEFISGNALHVRFPFLGPEVLAASLAPDDGHANPRLVAPAFGRAAARAGAQVLENTEIATIARAGEDFEAVATDCRRFRAPALLVTAGAWASLLSEQFGEPAPLVARGPQMAVTEPMPYALGPVLGVAGSRPEEVVYLRQVERGNIVFGGGNRGPAFPDVRRAYVAPANLLSQLAEISRLVPAIGAVRVIRSWSGIESYLPDDVPIMGPSARVAGLYYAFGFCGHGFQLGPGVGDVMAELIDRGATTAPIGPFGIGRFASVPAGKQRTLPGEPGP